MCELPPPMSIRVLHLRVQVHRADVRREHVDVVEVRVGAVLEQPGPAGLGSRRSSSARPRSAGRRPRRR